MSIFYSEAHERRMRIQKATKRLDFWYSVFGVALVGAIIFTVMTAMLFLG